MALVGLQSSATGAVADPAPQQGPTSGGTTVSDAVPGVRFTQIASGDFGGLAIGDDGNGYAWGSGAWGSLGNGAAADSPFPVQVQMPAGVRFTQVARGWTSYALGDDGNAYAWGRNDGGNLGNGTTTPAPGAGALVPIQIAVPEGVRFVQIANREYTAFALGADGNAYAWGSSGTSGELGNGTIYSSSVATPLPVPVTMPVGVRFTQIAAGARGGYALGEDGNAYAWGLNASGQLGNGEEGMTGMYASAVPIPVSMPAGVHFTQIAAGRSNGYALGDDGNAYAWGPGALGQLGNGTTAAGLVPAPIQRPAGVRFVQIAGGDAAAYAIGDDGNAYAWGLNARGQLGDGTTTSSSVPVRVQAPAGVSFIEVAAAFDQVFALGDDRNAYGWGFDYYLGALGQGPTTISTYYRLIPGPITGVAVTPVTFGGVAGAGLAQSGIAPGSTWSALTPPGCGPADVVVTWTQFGVPHTLTYPDGFVYGAPPSITAQPASGWVEYGGTFTAQVAASGDDVPGIQWQERDAAGSWVDLPGETAEVLTVSGVQTERHVRAVATNCWGVALAAVSDVATVVPVNGDAPGTSDGAGTSDGDRGGDDGAGGAVPDRNGADAGRPDGRLASTGGPSPAPWIAAGTAALLGGAMLVTIGAYRHGGAGRARSEALRAPKRIPWG